MDDLLVAAVVEFVVVPIVVSVLYLSVAYVGQELSGILKAPDYVDQVGRAVRAALVPDPTAVAALVAAALFSAITLLVAAAYHTLGPAGEEPSSGLDG